MNEHEFTLIVDQDPTRLTDELFEAGHGALVPEGGPARNVIHVSLEANSLAAAIKAAVHTIEEAGLNVVGVASDDLVSVKDVAMRTGRTYESVRLLAAGKRGPGGFPLPKSTGQWALYSWPDVAMWFAAHFGTEAPSEYERQIAAANYIVLARHMIADADGRSGLAKLLAA